MAKPVPNYCAQKISQETMPIVRPSWPTHLKYIATAESETGAHCKSGAFGFGVGWGRPACSKTGFSPHLRTAIEYQLFLCRAGPHWRTNGGTELLKLCEKPAPQEDQANVSMGKHMAGRLAVVSVSPCPLFVPCSLLGCRFSSKIGHFKTAFSLNSMQFIFLYQNWPFPVKFSRIFTMPNNGTEPKSSEPPLLFIRGPQHSCTSRGRKFNGERKGEREK